MQTPAEKVLCDTPFLAPENDLIFPLALEALNVFGWEDRIFILAKIDHIPYIFMR